MTLRIRLAWPDKALSPNTRGHWATKYRAQKDANEEGYWLTRQAMGAQLGPKVTKIEHDGTSDIILKQTAHPPDNRSRDRDNLDSRLKHHRDGIARAMGINDKHFRPTGIEWGAVVPNGEIIIELDVA
jgi:crossover junction endodeoxyribonuclease RusA